MNKNAFAKGEALQRLIELIGADKKALVNRDAELTALIEEVREMFKSDELTECTWDELVGFATAGELEPGHAYKINHTVTVGDKELTALIVTAKSESTLETIAIADDHLVHISDSGTETMVHDAIHFDDLVKLIIEGSKDSFAGTNNATSITDLPVDKSTVDVQVSADGTLSWAEGLEDGRDVLAIIHNTGDQDIAIILPDNSNAGVVTIPAGEYTEASVVSIDGTYYTRVPIYGVEYDEITSDNVQAMFDGTYIPTEGSSSKEITANDVQAMFNGTYGSL